MGGADGDLLDPASDFVTVVGGMAAWRLGRSPRTRIRLACGG